MKEFDINVREISETIVTVQAEDATEAELKVRKM